MSRVILRHDENKSVSFVQIVNFLVSSKTMSLEDGKRLYQKFKLGEDVVFDLPDQTASEFRDYLDFLNYKYE